VRKALLLVLVAFLVFTLTSCWDQQEITELAAIVGLGFDAGSRPEVLKISVLISPPGTSGVAGGQGGSGGTRLRVVTLEAPSLCDAMNLLHSHTRREPFLLHLSFVVFGEEFAKSGIAPAIGGLQGFTTIRGSVPVYVSVGTAEDLFHARSGIGRTPGQDIADLTSTAKGASLTSEVSVNDVISTLEGLSGELTLPILELVPLRLMSGDEIPNTGVGQEGEQLNEVIMARMALFNRDRWMADLDTYQTQLFIHLIDDTGRGSITIVNPADPTGIIAFQFERFSTNFSFDVTEDQVSVDIKNSVVTRVHEIQGGYDFAQKGFEPLTQTLENTLNTQVENVFSYLQSLGIDSLGLGEIIRRNSPSDWSKLEPKWEQIYPQISLTVETSVKVQTTGLVNKFFVMKRPQ